MKIGDIICGFELVRVRSVAEINSDVYELVHLGTGASLIFLDREDENMTFAISFATPPCDDTGVCHIIEHSVLCGSEKYPLKDPFAELLKGSLNTFLNAMTYEDKTVYPVSSRCKKDFYNLTDVYLDAVFHPALLDNPNVFRQEGWHYEYDGERLTRSGVVYNEMKGAYSSPDDIAFQELSRALFAGSVYERDSGGDPNKIPTLTYDNLIAFYKKYYHPSNAKICLDGSIDLEKTLALIDSHLSRFEKKDIKVEYRLTAKTVSERTVRYEVAQGEEDGRARILFGYVYAEENDALEQFKTTVLSDYLCGTNASPLKKELLSRGLCQDVMMYTSRAREQTVIIEVRDTDKDKIEEIKALVDSYIRELVREGLDCEALSATVDFIEFKLREHDFGGLPRGIGFALAALGTWLYGSNPESALEYEDTLRAVRAEITSGGFERTLLNMTVDNPHRATLIMLPDEHLADERAENEEAELAQILESLSENELRRIIDEEASLKAWQEADETDEAIASLPTLEISDIPKKAERVPRRVEKIGASECIFHEINTEKITYTDMYFDMSDVRDEDLYLVSIACAALTNLDTDRSSALALQNKLKSALGSFRVSTAISTKNGGAYPYLRVSASALDHKRELLVTLTDEILLHTDFSSTEEIMNIVKQTKSAYEDATLAAGHSVALDRLEAYTTARGALSDNLSGYGSYLKIKEICRDGADTSEIGERISKLLKGILTKERLILSLTGECDEKLAEKIIDVFPSGNAPVSIERAPLGVRREFLCVPVKVAYATAGAEIVMSPELSGSMRVARSILSYEYLWQNVRVSGGAYGAGFVPRRTGFVGFYSYRDPSPARSIGVFTEASQYLRTLAREGTDLTKFIIGAMGEYDVLQSPKNRAAMSSLAYICGITYEQLEREREGLLSTSLGDLIAVADAIDNATSTGAICIVGGKEHLADCREMVDFVLNL